MPYTHSAMDPPSVEATSDRERLERTAVEAVLASSAFTKRPRLASLLQYICERYFKGEADTIKEFSIAIDVFHRPQTFDQAADSIVRVEVFRLRKKLREFYDGEGKDQALEIVVATGHYRPEFVDRFPQVSVDSFPDNAPAQPISDHPATSERPLQKPQQSPNPEAGSPNQPPAAPVSRGAFGWRALLVVCVVLGIAGCAALTRAWLRRNRSANTAHASASSLASPALLPAGPDLRIRCGYAKPVFKDEEGNLWMGDRYFSGGLVTELRDQPIARTRDRELYLTGRTGVFSYKIPLTPGDYELRLHFAETTYSPSSSLGGGENSRVFDVQLNGHPLLTQFDIVSDAGANTADVRVFLGAGPEKDGYLHLDFTGTLGLPILNAVEIIPIPGHQFRPIRMVAQNGFFVDKAGNLWTPDTYFSSGQLAADKVVIGGTSDPGLYTGERYGNFTYGIPVAEGKYQVNLHFSEKYWGTDISKKGGVGSRVFDVFCNGVALTRKLDIVKEVGAGRALIKTYRGLRPNAQGKLILSFVPDVNYATVDAVEVTAETP